MPLLGSVNKRTFAARGVTATTWPTTPSGVSAAFVDLTTLKPTRGAVGDDRRGDRTGRYQMTAEIEQLLQLTIGRFGL